VAAGGGTVSPVTKLDTEAGEIAHRYPSFLPDGKSFLYVAATADAARVAIKVGSLDLSAEHRVLLDAGSAAVFADGYLLYVAAGTLMARPFDPVRLAFTGEARVLADAVGMTFGNTNNLGGQPSFSASPGVLAYVSQDLGQFTWRDRAGNVVGVLGDPGVLGRPELSPDGKRASVIVSQNGNRDIFTYDLQRSLPSRFTSDPATEDDGMWSPDGKWIAYYSNETGRQEIYVAPFPGPGEKKRVSASGGVVPRWRRDGRELFYVALDGTLMAAAVAVRNGVLEVTNDSRLFGVLPTAAGYPYDVSADGQRFLTVVAGPGVSTAQLTVVRNWRAAFEK
jgi:hypothetical protein